MLFCHPVRYHIGFRLSLVMITEVIDFLMPAVQITKILFSYKKLIEGYLVTHRISSEARKTAWKLHNLEPCPNTQVDHPSGETTAGQTSSLHCYPRAADTAPKTFASTGSGTGCLCCHPYHFQPLASELKTYASATGWLTKGRWQEVSGFYCEDTQMHKVKNSLDIGV